MSSDIGLVSPKWLQSDDNFSFDTLGDIDALMVDLSDFVATLPRLSHFSAMPTSVDQFEAAPPRPSRPCLQRLMVMNCSNYKTKTTKNQQINGWIVSRDGRNTRELQEHYWSWTNGTAWETLKQFYAEVRREDGSEHEPDSLRVMLDCHFRENGTLKRQGFCV